MTTSEKPLDMSILGGDVVFPDFGVMKADIGVQDGKIAVVARPGELGVSRSKINASGKHVFPGVIDPHLHVEFADGLSGWRTETASAALGGVTTVLNYLPSQSTSYSELIEETRSSAQESSPIDFGFHLICCEEVHLSEMSQYVEQGVSSFKYFMSFRGDEGAYLGISGTNDDYLYRYLKMVASLGGVAAVHAENIEISWGLRAPLKSAGRTDIAAWDESRPSYIEAEACYRAMFYAREADCPLYIVHVSGERPLEEILEWKRRFPASKVFLETCPHYLTHTKDDVGEGPIGKVNPPLRSAQDRDALWDAVTAGSVSTIGSDHCPRKRDEKTGGIWSSAGGFPGVGTILPIMLNEGHHKRGVSLERIAALLCKQPAEAFGLSSQKGTIAPGLDADFAIVDLNREFEITAERLNSYSDYSLYDTWKVKGLPTMTLVRGRVVAKDGAVTDATVSWGKYLLRG